MIHIQDMQYLRLGTADLDGAVKFATETVGLELVRRENGRAYVRGDDRDHDICYVAGDPAEHIVGLKMADRPQFEAAAEELKRNGIAVTRGTPAECEDRRVADFIGFRDLSGNKIELVYRPHISTRRYFPSRDAGILEFSHIGLRTGNAPRDEEFWGTMFNFRANDWIGQAGLISFDEVHHRFALFPAPGPAVQHINFQVASLDDVMRSYYYLSERQVHIVFGPGRHLASTACFLYFDGPDGVVYEYSWGVRDCDETWRPRQIPFEDGGFCMWGAKPDVAEFMSKD
jgi:2,3-dihydroxy-p-cumate/2,3-dihydroxybenzoate 3,4-dioxygenase